MVEPSSYSAQHAIEPRASAWVGANAGSGKTYILVSRLVRLMLDGVAPEKLLCLTYTRAAAAEMQERLFDLLGQWALKPDDELRAAIIERLGDDAALTDSQNLARARALFARALETPGGLRVQTIHAFCESLLKRFPLEAGLSPQFELLDEQDAADMQAAIISAIMLHSQKSADDDTPRDLDVPFLSASMALLTRALNETDLLSLGRLIINRRTHLGGDYQPRLAALSTHLNLDETVSDAHTSTTAKDWLVSQLATDYAAISPKLVDWLRQGGKQDNDRADGLQQWFALLGQENMAAAWAAVSGVFLTDEGAPRARLITKGRIEADPQAAEIMAEFGAAVLALSARIKALTTYEMTQAVYVFAEQLLRAYEAEKRRRAVLDYDDLISATNHLLAGAQAAQWVLFKIDRGLEHILVDEAQDTSPAQWRVIRALADEFFNDETAHDGLRTLFAVGDEKQSIFSFQGADPTEFAAQRSHFEQSVGRFGGDFYYVPLQQSRRSAPQILQLVDYVFATEENCAGVTADGQPMHHTAFRADAVGHVELWTPEKSVGDDSDIALWDVPDMQAAVDGRAALAARMADKIAALLADEKQNVTAGDILILVRKRDGFVEDMTRALKRRAIAVAGADRMVLLDQIAVMDILAALDVALNPLDDMALAIVLRSPLGGLSEEQLFALAHGRKAGLWSALKAENAEDAHRNDSAYQSAFARLSWLRRHIHRLPVYELLAQFLAAQGAHKLLHSRLGPEIDDPINELLRLALVYEARHAASAQGFVHWLRQGQQEIKRDMEGRGAAVRIMTVHGAKGLEAPIVFLPDTCRAPVKQGGAVDRLQFNEQDLPLWRAAKILRDPYSAAQIEWQNKLAAQEERRLLYVALTRARDRLYIGGWLGKRDGQPAAGSWYQMIDAALENAGNGDASEILAGGEVALPRPDEESDAAQNVVIEAPPAWLTRPPAKIDKPRYYGDKLFSPSSLMHDTPPQLALAESPAQEEALERAAQRGTIMHKLLESLPHVPEAQRAQAADDYLARMAAAQAGASALALSAQDRQAMIDEALAVMQDAELADLFAPHALAEVPLAGVLPMDDGQKLALSGQIDRMVVRGNDIQLVDFKTGQPPSSPQNRYVLQMAAYRALVQQLYADKPVHCLLVWTQTGRIDRLAAHELDIALAAIMSGEKQLP